LPLAARAAIIRARDARVRGAKGQIMGFRTATAALLGALILSACGQKSGEEVPDSFTPERVASAAGADRIGRLYRYVRTNRDGSDPEDVYVFRKSATAIQVYKARRKCAEAGFVTAELDLDRGYARKIVGGRLTRQGQQEVIAVVDYAPSSHELKLRAEIEGRPPIVAAVKIEKEPWHLYDFDFASLTVMTPRAADRKADFSFGLPLLIADPDRPEPLVYLGEAEATFREETEKLGRPAYRFALGGPAFGTFGGNLWLDAREGHILEVETGFPNHLEYQDFRLSLRSVDDGGEVAWAKLLREHFEGCG
jgi:hypothetical protein